MSEVVLQQVSRWYNNVVAVNDVTMTIGPGITDFAGNPMNQSFLTSADTVNGEIAPPDARERERIARRIHRGRRARGSGLERVLVLPQRLRQRLRSGQQVLEYRRHFSPSLVALSRRSAVVQVLGPRCRTFSAATSLAASGVLE